MIYPTMKVERAVDEFAKKEWAFIVDPRNGDGIILQSYTEFYRETTRSKWKPSRNNRYDRLMDRENTIGENLVPISDEIKTEARAQLIAFVNALEFKTWER